MTKNKVFQKFSQINTRFSYMESQLGDDIATRMNKKNLFFLKCCKHPIDRERLESNWYKWTEITSIYKKLKITLNPFIRTLKENRTLNK